MRLIVAIIRPEALESVRSAASESGVCLFSVTPVEEDSGQKGIYRGAEHRVKSRKLRVELIVEDSISDSVLGEMARSSSGVGVDRVCNDMCVVIPCSDSLIHNHQRPLRPPAPDAPRRRIPSRTMRHLDFGD